MNYKILIYLILSFILFSCNQNNKFENINVDYEKYKNSGFALIYNDNLDDIKKLEPRSLNIYHKSLKKKSIVKIINPKNNKYLIAEVKSNRG